MVNLVRVDYGSSTEAWVVHWGMIMGPIELARHIIVAIHFVECFVFSASYLRLFSIRVSSLFVCFCFYNSSNLLLVLF